MLSQGFEWLVDGVAETVGDSLFAGYAQIVNAGVGEMLAAMGTAWVDVGVPVLSTDTGAQLEGHVIEGVGDVSPVLDWLAWGGIAAAVIAIVALAMMMMVNARRGESMWAIGRMGVVLIAVGLIGAAGPVAREVVGNGPRGVGGAAGFIQSNVWGWLLVLVTLSVLVGSVRIIIEQRAEPIKDLLKSLVTVAAVSALGATVVALLVTATDRFSEALLSRALDCDASNASCFNDGLAALFTMGSPAGVQGVLLTILLGLLTLVVSGIQIVFLIVRGALLVVLTGVLPLTAAFTNTQMGRTWFNRSIGWLIALILYKPVAAIIYATAFQLLGDGTALGFPRWDNTLLTLMAGLSLMILALVAMPALMRFVTPGVSAVMAAGGGGMAMGAGMAVAQGATMAAYRAGGSRSTGGQNGRSGSSGEQGQSGQSVAGGAGGQGATGSSGSDGRATQGAPGSTGAAGATGGSGNGGQGTTGAAGRSGSAGASGAGGAAGQGAKTAAGSKAATGAAAAATGGAVAIAATAQAGLQATQAVAKGASDSIENTADGSGK